MSIASKDNHLKEWAEKFAMELAYSSFSNTHYVGEIVYLRRDVTFGNSLEILLLLMLRWLSTIL